MKRYFAAALAFVLFVTAFPVSALASPASRYIYDENGSRIEVTKISESELPEGVVPLVVDSAEEAEALMLALSEEHTSNYAEIQATASGNALITKVQYGGILTSGFLVTELRVEYTTDSGKITWTYPYTDTYGFSFFVTFSEINASGYVTSNGKDYYGIATGQLDYYFFIKGEGLEVFTKTVSLSGTVTLVS